MRRKRENQRLLSGLWTDHRLAQELRAVSKIMDENSSIVDLVLHDLCDTDSIGQGPPGLSAEQFLRAAILKQWQQLSYTRLASLLAVGDPGAGARLRARKRCAGLARRGLREKARANRESPRILPRRVASVAPVRL